jgi:hypothetical protein
MAWPAKVGELLPRAEEAVFAPEKWSAWILAERGHGQDWGSVFGVELGDRDRGWEAITAASISAVIDTVRETPDGITCAVLAEITLGERSARVAVVWHYADEHAAPRLLTAYPTL